MIKSKSKTEAGKKAYKEWKQGNLRGLYNIGQQIIKDYELTQEDLDDKKRETWNTYQRLRRKRKKIINDNTS